MHGHPNDPEDIQKRAMVYISSNTILSIREEEIIPLGASESRKWRDMCGAVSSASGERARVRVKR